MKRKTITIDDELYEMLQKIRASMISHGMDMSFTTTANIVMVSGILGSEKFDDKIWEGVAEFFHEAEHMHVQSEELINHYTEYLLRRLAKLKDVRRLES